MNMAKYMPAGMVQNLSVWAGNCALHLHARRLPVCPGLNNEGQLVNADKKLIEQPFMPLISSQLFGKLIR
jgi:hypothetical protein